MTKAEIVLEKEGWRYKPWYGNKIFKTTSEYNIKTQIIVGKQISKAQYIIAQEDVKRKKLQHHLSVPQAVPAKDREDNDSCKDILNEVEQENGNNVMS